MDWTTVSTFLSGSVITFIAKEAITAYHKNADYRRDIAKIYYTRKLEIAEKAVAFFSLYKNQLEQIKKTFQVIVSASKQMDSKNFNFSTLQTAMSANEKIIGDLMSTEHLEIYSIHLYFNLIDEAKWSEKDLEEFMLALAELKSLDDEMIDRTNQFQQSFSKDPDSQQTYFLESEIRNALPYHYKKIEDVAEIFQKNKLAIDAMINAIKKEIQK
jgi:hypothetical protein